MKHHWNEFLSHNSGFTLFELLIAMLLTAIIGAVMFKTWDLVIHAGTDSRQLVALRERERTVFGILDNDMAGMIFPSGDGLPLPSAAPVEPATEFYEALGRKQESTLPPGASILLSFACGASINPHGIKPEFPVCVEYRLQKTLQGSDLVRRERQACGISGDFPWQETILFKNIDTAKFEFIFPNGRTLARWTPDDLAQHPQAIRFAWRPHGEKERELLFSIFPQKMEIGWDED